MKRTISNKIQLGTTLNPLDVGYIPSVDDEANLENLYSKVNKIGEFWKNGKADDNLARYIANLTGHSRQNQIACTLHRKSYASQMYSDLKNIEFIIELTPITFSTCTTMYVVLPLQFPKSPTKTAQLDDTMITVITVLDIGLKIFTYSNICIYTIILPTNSSVEVYEYSLQQPTYLSENL